MTRSPSEPGSGLAARRQREAERLRENLHRRKLQARARTETDTVDVADQPEIKEIAAAAALPSPQGNEAE